MRGIEAVVFVVVLVAAVVAGVLNAQWYGGGWWVQITVNGPSYIDVRLSDMYGHIITVPGGWTGALGPVYGWSDTVYAQIVSGPSGCYVNPSRAVVYEWWPYITFTISCPSSTTPPPTTTTAPPTVTVTSTSTTTVTLTATSTATATTTITTTATVTYTTTVTSPVTVTATTTVTTPIIVRKAHNGWVTILLAIITNLAKGFHWLASRFAFKPITQVQADFYVPIVEWGWNYAFGTRVIVLPNGHAIVSNGTTTATLTLPNGTTTVVILNSSSAIHWSIVLYGSAKWVIQDNYGNYVSGSSNSSGIFYITGPTDVIRLTAPAACQVAPSRSVAVGAGSTVTFTINCRPNWLLYYTILYSCNIASNPTWTVSDNYGDTQSGGFTTTTMVCQGYGCTIYNEATGAFTYTINDLYSILYASISSGGAGNWQVTNTISPTSTVVPQPPSGVTTVTFNAGCQANYVAPTSTSTTSTPLPSGWWILYISVSDNPGVSYTIQDNYGNSYSNSKSVSNVAFASYWPDATVTLTASTVPGCTITPASTTVASSGQNQYVSFTVSCGSGTSSSTTPTPTPTLTSTPTPTTTPTGTPPPTTTPTPTPTTTPTSTTSSPPPTTVTSITTVTTPIPKVVNDYAMGCAPGTVPLGSEVAFECFIALNGYAGIQAAAQGSVQGGAYETATLTYTVNGQTATPGGVIGSWYWSGSCPPGTELVFQASNMNHVWNLNGATDTTITWFVTVTAYCQPKGAQFAFLSTWSPPELPIDWLLRGGTDVEGVIAPLYLRAWDAYVNAWLNENGPMLDLLILLALITPVLARPATRRIRLT